MRFVVPVLAALSLLAYACKPQSISSGAGGASPSASAKTVAERAVPSGDATAAGPLAPRPAHSGPVGKRPDGTASETLGTTTSSDPARAPSESPSSVGLPAIDFGPPGRLTIRGYPRALELGMRDFATWVGYSKDGAVALACGSMSPLGGAKGTERGDTCFVRRTTGKTERIFALTEGKDDWVVTREFADTLKLISEGRSQTLRVDEKSRRLHPPALDGDWPYATDIALSVSKIERKGGSEVLRVGGSVTNRETVYPISLTVDAKPEDQMTYAAEWNAIVANPERGEIAFMGHFYCMEWCDDMVITRLSNGKLASLIFNDTGFAAHGKKDYAASRDLFLKAVWADPQAPLPPYNLACAYARLHDEANAAKALKLAIAVGGEKVRDRAKSDADFKTVLAAEWFRKLTH